MLSRGLLVLVLVGMLGAGVLVGRSVITALPDVGKDLHPADPWSAPVAVERKSNGWLIGHIPACAQSSVTGLVVWDDHSRPLWEVRGETFPFGDFLVGYTPPGLRVVQAYVKPKAGQSLRLAVFRSPGRPAGVTFRISSLHDGKVRYGGKWVTPQQFKASAKCVKPKSATAATASTTVP